MTALASATVSSLTPHVFNNLTEIREASEQELKDDHTLANVSSVAIGDIPCGPDRISRLEELITSNEKQLKDHRKEVVATTSKRMRWLSMKRAELHAGKTPFVLVGLGFGV